jgi:hypothetical protein
MASRASRMIMSTTSRYDGTSMGGDTMRTKCLNSYWGAQGKAVYDDGDGGTGGDDDDDDDDHDETMTAHKG